MASIQKRSRKNKVIWSVDGKMPDIQPYTRVKHELLESYLGDWVTTITNNRRYVPGERLTLIDGFCGGGVYRDGESTCKGSPIRMLQAVDRAWREVSEQRPYLILDIAYLFVDVQKEHTDF